MIGGMTFATSGIDIIIRNMHQFNKNLAGKMPAAMKAGGRVLLDKANYFVPVDTGALLSTGRVEVFGTGLATDVRVAYGGKTDAKNVDYALYVHEDLEAAHGRDFNAKHANRINAGLTHPRRPQEKAKFLEDASNDAGTRKAMLDTIRKKLQ